VRRDPDFVIGLREGVEALPIVGIIAAFLNRNGRRDALRQMWLGVLAAVALCLLIVVGWSPSRTSCRSRRRRGWRRSSAPSPWSWSPS
jgi:FTR1 family protein